MSCRIASTILRGFRNGPLLDISRAFCRKEHNSTAADPSIRPVQIANDSVPVFHSRRGFCDLLDIQAWEISTGRIVAVKDLPTGVQRMMKKHGVTGAEHKSIASHLLWHFAAMGRATQAEAGYPSLKKGRATRNAKTMAADLLKAPDSLRKAIMRRAYYREYYRKKNGKLAKTSAQEETEVPAHEEIDASHSPKPKRRVSREATRK